MREMDDDELAAALGLDDEPQAAASHTPREERIMAGFEDILRFYQTHGRMPQHGAERDIFERLYAVRLESLRKLPEAATLLRDMDTPGLLNGTATETPATMDDDALLAALVGADGPEDGNDIRVLRHVRSSSAKRAAEEVAVRTRCADFEHFKPKFEQVERELKAAIRKTLRFGRDTSITSGNYFILGGQLAYVAEVGDTLRAPNGESDELHNLNRSKLENLFHRLFGAAQLDLIIEDRFGHPVKPREWFLVPLHVIDEAVAQIRDGSIVNRAYDPQTARLIEVPQQPRS